MCIKQFIIYSYLSPCKVNGDNKPQVVIYISVIMPFYKPDRAYTANRPVEGR